MDRSAFLASMPFLLPTCLDDFPRSVDYSVESLLTETFFLSIEPVSCKGPAYFSVETGSDPSICPVELAYLYRRAMDKEDNFAESATFVVDSRGSMDDSSEYTSLGLMIRIDGRVYAVDVALLCSLKIICPSTTEHGERPASLLLNFSSCTFRVFSKYSDDRSKMEDAKTKLTYLIQKNCEEVWKQGLHFLDSSSIDSPSTTSTRHKESQNSSTTTDVLQNKIINHDTDTVPVAVERLNKRRLFQGEFNESVAKLNMIYTHLPNLTDGDLPHYRQAAYNTMTAAAEAQGKSFASPLDISMAAQHFEGVAHNACQNTEQLLERFFPSKAASALRQESILDPISIEEMVSEQLKKRQKAVTERTNLLLFPTRG